MRLLDRIARKSYRAFISGLNFQDTRQCPMCKWTGFQFEPANQGPFFRFDATCPRCKSQERHRLAHMLLAERLPARLGKVLHFAPEPCMSKWLGSRADDYHTADLMVPTVMHKEDICNMTFADETFDLVWCSHILEHVTDDLKAMREIRRVLKPNGVAVIQVPVWGAKTSDEPLNTPEERVLKYFQEDHVRRYGADIEHRLRAADLAVETLRLGDLDLQVVLRHGLSDLCGSEVFLTSKAAA
jgi:SAM-dependent methyltransferase